MKFGNVRLYNPMFEDAGRFVDKFGTTFRVTCLKTQNGEHFYYKQLSNEEARQTQLSWFPERREGCDG